MVVGLGGGARGEYTVGCINFIFFGNIKNRQPADIKQQRAFRTFKRQRTVKTSSSTGFSGSGHQAAENSQDIKQKRFFRIRTSGGGGQSGHQAEKVFQDQDIRGRRTNGTSNSR